MVATFIFAVFFGGTAQAQNLPGSLDISFECVKNCQRGVISKVDGKWQVKTENVDSFQINIRKLGGIFEMHASAQPLGDGTTATLLYRGRIDETGRIWDAVTTGKLYQSGELTYQDDENSCDFTPREDLGAGLFSVECKSEKALDFSGLAVRI